MLKGTQSTDRFGFGGTGINAKGGRGVGLLPANGGRNKRGSGSVFRTA